MIAHKEFCHHKGEENIREEYRCRCVCPCPDVPASTCAHGRPAGQTCPHSLNLNFVPKFIATRAGDGQVKVTTYNETPLPSDEVTRGWRATGFNGFLFGTEADEYELGQGEHKARTLVPRDILQESNKRVREQVIRHCCTDCQVKLKNNE